VEGRSAVETARAWLAVTSPGLPPEVQELLASDPDFGAVEAWEAEPEALVPFDGFSGPANLDLLLRARDGRGEVSASGTGRLHGPFEVPGAPLFGTVAALYVGKAVREMREVPPGDDLQD
jgi:hypothetical protein